MENRESKNTTIESNDFERALSFINKHNWTFAKTMAEIPHWYLMVNRISDKKEFEWFDAFIHENGEIGYFGKRMFKYLYLNGYKYWDCDDQVSITDLINRDCYKKRTKSSNTTFDLFNVNQYEEQDLEIRDIVDELSFERILIPNCSDLRVYNALHKTRKPRRVLIKGTDESDSDLSSVRGITVYKDKMSHLYLGKQDLILCTNAENLDTYDIKRIVAHAKEGTSILLFTDKLISEKNGLKLRTLKYQNVLTNIEI